jgi:hypothetical protein
MSNFIPDLRSELVAAAAREEERRIPRAWWPTPRLEFLGAAVAATAAIVVVLATGGLRSEPAHHGAVPGARPTPEGQPLFGGSLEKGVRYHTQSFIPALSFVATGPDWEVGDATSPEALGINLRGKRDDTGLERPRGMVGFVRVTQVYDPAVKGLQRSLTTSPADLYAWMRSHPDLRVGPETQATIAGVPGRRFDVTARFDRPAHAQANCVGGSLDPCTLLAPNVGLFSGDRLRVTILQTEPDPIVVFEVAYPGTAPDVVQKAAAPLLKSLRIGVG